VADVDVELARSAQLVARARRQVAVERLVKAKRQLGGIYVARAALVVAVPAFDIAGITTSSSYAYALLGLAAVCLLALWHNVRTAGPQYRAAVTDGELELAHAHTAWEAAMQRMLDTEARHEETP
jgi:hypothetical protein